MMEDFPFLCAIQKKWHISSTSIIADYPDKHLFQETGHFKPNSKHEIWIVFTEFGRDNDFEIRQVNAPAGTMLGRAIFYNSGTGIVAIEYVMVAEKSHDTTTVIIYKPPKNVRYNPFIVDSYREITGQN